MSFAQELQLVLVDKLGIGILILLAGFFLNKILKRDEIKAAFQTEILKLKHSLSNDLQKLTSGKRLGYAEDQLSRFYWPLYVRWFTLESVRSVRKKHATKLEQNTYALIEQENVLQSEMVDIFNSGIHLMESNDPLFQALLSFCKYAAAFRAEMDTIAKGNIPEYVQEFWPIDLRKLLVAECLKIQDKYDKLVIELGVS